MESKLEKLYAHYLKHPVVSTDSRNIPESSIFFALRGDNFNGNKFAESALLDGASFAVVDDPEIAKDGRFVLVDDTLKALQSFAIFHRQNIKGKIIGITGSNGKTTTKELIYKVLSSTYKTRATKGNLNNHIGVPLTLLSFPINLEFGIVEMGANHIGEIAELCEIAQPDYGLITNIGKAHLEGFGSFEGVIKAKSELYDFLRHNNKKAFVNKDNEILDKAASNISQISYGSKDAVDYQGELISSNPFVKCNVKLPGDTIHISSHLVGGYNFENIFAATAIGAYFGVKSEKIKEAIENYLPDNNRSQVVKTNKNTLILDAYNANPSSMNVAISSFEESPYKNKVLILGEMRELGEFSKKEHQTIVEQIKGRNFDQVIFVGEEYSNEFIDNVLFIKSTFDLFDYLKANPITGKTILIKGSRGNKLESIFDLL